MKEMVCAEGCTSSEQELSLRPQRYDAAFYSCCGTVELARALLGARLVTVSHGALCSGMVVEVEAYLGSNDPACHAARGKTPRNAVMFEAPGHCYVYLIYGMYLCMNVVSDPQGVGSAVLIRAVEPLEGISVMHRRRSQSAKTPRAQRDLARGPGRLCQALAVSRSFSGEHFSTSPRVWLEPYREVKAKKIETSGRIGISAGSDLPLRFYLRDNQWVSGKRR